MSARYRIVCLLSAALLFAGIGRAECPKLQPVFPPPAAVVAPPAKLKKEKAATPRHLQDMEVAVEVKFAVVADDVFQNLKRGGVFGDAAKGVVFVKDPQVFLLMEVLQNDVRSNVMQAPKLTMFNRQTANVNAIDKQFFVTGVEIVQRNGKVEYQQKTEVVPLGLQMSLRSVVSADRRRIRLHLDATLNNLDSSEIPLRQITTRIEPAKDAEPDVRPVVFNQYIQQPRLTKVRIDRTLSIPDGSTAVLTGWKQLCDVDKNIGPRFLGEIPYVGQLFHKAERETHHLVVLVTPRIIVQEKERGTGYVSPHAVIP
ncbi:MAG TPA: hypothetical protein VN688_01455 [Gemmataceae bacterium]|nr:hypothetical protein [Gemmataceae bacterium]